MITFHLLLLTFDIQQFSISVKNKIYLHPYNVKLIILKHDWPTQASRNTSLHRLSMSLDRMNTILLPFFTEANTTSLQQVTIL